MKGISRRTCSVAAALGLVSCATAPLDADPNSLNIEIGRYSALLGQVVEHTGVSYDHAGGDLEGDSPAALQGRLNEVVADYNAVSAALCASKAGAATFVQVRAQSCGRAFQPAWSSAAVDYLSVARRSRIAGRHIIGLWDAVCTEARALEKDPETMVCPME